MQLLVFLNRAHRGTRPDGSEVHGFPRAARTYFGKEVAALSRDEWIALVATAPEANADRAGRIRKLLSGACRPSGLRDVTYEACR
jgi:membrane carboxypeptidase/penicillin-binding protein